MSALSELRKCNDLSDLAILLNYRPSSLAYIIYKIPDLGKYTTFEIPKSSGGNRTIKKPISRLAKLQRRVADYLYDCLDEIEIRNGKDKYSHGYRKGRSIITNAKMHKRKRYVFNVDIEDFFGSINFGRVRGYFINDNNFKLKEPVATVLAQIVIHENGLPQGAPTSPIVSELVARILDARLVRFAKVLGVRYSRYVDDLSFSSRRFEVSSALAVRTHGDEWVAGDRLRQLLERSGFQIKDA